MRRTTIGRALIDMALPADMRGRYDKLDKAGVAKLFDDLARLHPEQYREVAKKLTDRARESAQATGGFSFGLEHLRPTAKGEAIKAQLKQEIDRVAGNPAAVSAILARYQKPLEDAVFEESRANGNPLAHQVANVGRGNKASLKALLAGDLLYEDHHLRPIPIAVTTPYSSGLRPSEYFAASFGARKGTVDTKIGTAQAGYFCLHAETMVRMADGSAKMIKDIVVGDWVCGWDRDLFRVIPVEVKAVHDNGPRECVRFTSEAPDTPGMGWELVATPDHNMLCQGPNRDDDRDLVEAAIRGRQEDGSASGWRWQMRPLADYEAGATAVFRVCRSLCTPAARTLMADGELPVLQAGDYLGAMGYYQMTIRGAGASPFERLGLLPTFDLTVAHRDHLFILANGLVVSNSKQLNQVSHRLVVTGMDHDDDENRSDRGLPVDTQDRGNIGALLARTAGIYPRNTVLTARHLAALAADGHDRILVRSPMVGGPPQGGVFARDVGVREKNGRLSPRGDYVGLAAAQAIGEKVSQGTLSSKHSGGVAGQSSGPTGFKLLDAYAQIPKVFPGGAAHAQRDGTVGSIQDAPQGGRYVDVSGTRHYVAADQDVTAKVGDKVEAGDLLSDGIPNPAELVAHKGVGEGRRLFVQAFGKALTSSGVHASRRNLELLARGLIDHVVFDDEVGPHNPGDIRPYQSLEANYEPRDGARERLPKEAIGQYLERPVLHHTIGTMIKPSMVADLERFGIDKVLVHGESPPFHPQMIRAKSAMEHDDDWMTRHLGSNLQRSTLEAAHRGRVSDTAGTSYVPALAERSRFGLAGATKGWEPRDGDGDGHVYDGKPHEREKQAAALAYLSGFLPELDEDD